MIIHLRLLHFILAVSLLPACKKLPHPLAPLPPYQQYVRSLDQADLLESKLARQWIQAGEQILFADSVPFDLPFSFTSVFEAGTPAAHGFRFNILAGQKLSITGNIMADGKVFTDLFVHEEETWSPIYSSDSAIHINREFDRSTACLLRIQPELLATARYSITINSQPVLLNPVSGAENKDIGSVYGDPREGGRRSHEGVDIFAPRGTPVIAPAAGRITRTGISELGGKVIWMRDRDRSQAYYFAHLDSQMVRGGERVVPGDTIGLVGNTGNARRTPPHLHFGIYQQGSKDPMSYIRTVDIIDESAAIDTTFNLASFRVSSNLLNLRSGPGKEHPVVTQLGLHEYVEVTGRSGNWVKVNLVDGPGGFLFSELLEPLESTGTLDISIGMPVFSYADSLAVPLQIIADNTKVELLAKTGEFLLVKTAEGVKGWIVRE